MYNVQMDQLWQGCRCASKRWEVWSAGGLEFQIYFRPWRPQILKPFENSGLRNYEVIQEFWFKQRENTEQTHERIFHIPIVAYWNAKYCHSGHLNHLTVIFLLQYTFFVVSKDSTGELVEKPLQIQVIVEDINDNPPVCQQDLTVLEVQENEQGGKKRVSVNLYTCL